MRDGKLYLDFNSSKDWIGDGTLFPFAVTRCFLELEIPSSSSLVSGLVFRLFLFKSGVSFSSFKSWF